MLDMTMRDKMEYDDKGIIAIEGVEIAWVGNLAM